MSHAWSAGNRNLLRQSIIALWSSRVYFACGMIEAHSGNNQRLPPGMDVECCASTLNYTSHLQLLLVL